MVNGAIGRRVGSRLRKRYVKIAQANWRVGDAPPIATFMATDRPHILLVDDDRELSAMLKEYLEGEGFLVDVAHDGEAGLEASRNDYSAIILDIMMPGMSGIEVLRELRKHSTTPVIMLTAKGDQVDRVVGLELGADDYIAKPYYAREVVARIRAVLRRHEAQPDTHQPLRFRQLVLDGDSRTVLFNEEPVELTATEFAMLQLLLRNPQTVSDKGDLSVHALGRKREAYDRSVDVHISNLRLKLVAASGGTLTIETVRGVGYRLAGKGSPGHEK